MFDANTWDGKSELITTHRSDEMLIIKEVAVLRERLSGEDAFFDYYGCRHVWRPWASEVWNAGCAAICDKYGITNNLLFHWFADRADEYLAAIKP